MKHITAVTRNAAAIVALSVTGATAFAASPPGISWSRSFGSPGVFTWTFDVAVDGLGNPFAAGATEGSLGGQRAGGTDAFLTKFDTAGNVLWSRQLGTNQDDRAWSVATDHHNSVFLAGNTGGNLGGTNSGGLDAFLARYDSAGNQLWLKQFGKVVAGNNTAVETDKLGNAYFAATTKNEMAGNHLGGFDAALIKFDAAGNVLWSQQFGTAGDDQIRSVTVDNANNAYVGGWRGSNAFIYKFDAAGNYLWSRNFQGITWRNIGISVAVDALDNIYMSGFTDGDFGGLNAGDDDAFVIKLDATGNTLWTRQLGTPYDEAGDAIAIDAAGNAIITGSTRGVLGSTIEGTFNDVFLAKYDPAGELLWTQQFRDAGFESANAIAISPYGNTYIGGSQGTYLQVGFLTKFVVPEPASNTVVALAAFVAHIAFNGRRRIK